MRWRKSSDAGVSSYELQYQTTPARGRGTLAIVVDVRRQDHCCRGEHHNLPGHDLPVRTRGAGLGPSLPLPGAGRERGRGGPLVRAVLAAGAQARSCWSGRRWEQRAGLGLPAERGRRSELGTWAGGARQRRKHDEPHLQRSDGGAVVHLPGEGAETPTATPSPTPTCTQTTLGVDPATNRTSPRTATRCWR